ncbi:hypothetical protein ACLOJK_006977 [Asimina triloba]
MATVPIDVCRQSPFARGTHHHQQHLVCLPQASATLPTTPLPEHRCSRTMPQTPGSSDLGRRFLIRGLVQRSWMVSSASDRPDIVPPPAPPSVAAPTPSHCPPAPPACTARPPSHILPAQCQQCLPSMPDADVGSTLSCWHGHVSPTVNHGNGRHHLH